MKSKKSGNELHAEAMQAAGKIKQLIDDLKGLPPEDSCAELHSLEEQLGQLSQRAHVFPCKIRYERATCKY